MNNVLRLPALGLFLSLAACSSDKKDDPTPSTPATPAAGLRWTEGGTTYTATITANCASGGSAAPATVTFTTLATPAACPDPAPVAVSSVFATPSRCSSTIQAATWCREKNAA